MAQVGVFRAQGLGSSRYRDVEVIRKQHENYSRILDPGFKLRAEAFRV